jgi:hypothetical protein
VKESNINEKLQEYLISLNDLIKLKNKICYTKNGKSTIIDN